VEHISPFLEPTGSGVSTQWARSAARKYGCTVAVGYPERTETPGAESGAEPEYYNALTVVDSDGEKLANYRKSFLYYTDETWAREGQGFYGGKLGSFGQVAMGICMLLFASDQVHRTDISQAWTSSKPLYRSLSGPD
jgi:predicted amidohydrolase